MTRIEGRGFLDAGGIQIGEPDEGHVSPRHSFPRQFWPTSGPATAAAPAQRTSVVIGGRPVLASAPAPTGEPGYHIITIIPSEATSRV